MALKDILEISTTRKKKIGLSPERVEAVIPTVRQYVAFWREYPDLFVDFLVRGYQTEEDWENPKDDSKFRFYFY